MRVLLALLLIPAAWGQPLPGWITSLMPRSKTPAVQKADRIMAELQGPHRQGLEFVFTEAEANIWLREAWRSNPNTGFSDPMVNFPAKNQVRAVFDFDLNQFLAWRPNWRGRARRVLGVFPASRKRLSIQVQFTTERRKLRMHIVEARLNGAYVAPQLLNLGLRFLQRWKQGRLNVVDGVDLPWGIHHIVATKGEIRIGT